MHYKVVKGSNTHKNTCTHILHTNTQTHTNTHSTSISCVPLPRVWISSHVISLSFLLKVITCLCNDWSLHVFNTLDRKHEWRCHWLSVRSKSRGQAAYVFFLWKSNGCETQKQKSGWMLRKGKCKIKRKGKGKKNRKNYPLILFWFKIKSLSAVNCIIKGVAMKNGHCHLSCLNCKSGHNVRYANSSIDLAADKTGGTIPTPSERIHTVKWKTELCYLFNPVLVWMHPSPEA